MIPCKTLLTYLHVYECNLSEEEMVRSILPVAVRLQRPRDQPSPYQCTKRQPVIFDGSLPLSDLNASLILTPLLVYLDSFPFCRFSGLILTASCWAVRRVQRWTQIPLFSKSRVADRIR